MAVGNPVAVRGQLLQLVVFEAVKGGSVALGGGAKQLVCAREARVLFLSAVSCTGTEDAP